MTVNDLPEKLRIPGVKLVQHGEKPKETIKLNDADMEMFGKLYDSLMKGA